LSSVTNRKLRFLAVKKTAISSAQQVKTLQFELFSQTDYIFLRRVLPMIQSIRQVNKTGHSQLVAIKRLIFPTIKTYSALVGTARPTSGHTTMKSHHATIKGCQRLGLATLFARSLKIGSDAGHTN
jgi:hypothetical protein